MLNDTEVTTARGALYVAISSGMITQAEHDRINEQLKSRNWQALSGESSVIERMLPVGEPYVSVLLKLLLGAPTAPPPVAPRPPAVPPPSPSPVVTPAPPPVVEGEEITEDDLRWLADKLAPYLPAASGGAPGVVSSTGSAVLQFRANTDGGPWQGGESGEMVGNVQLNGYDAGMRVEQNWNGTGQPKLPWCYWGGDSQGTWSYAWYPPVGGPGEGGDRSLVAGPDFFENLINNDGVKIKQAYQGQTFVVDGGAQGATAGDGARYLSTRHHVLLCSQRESWDMYLCVTPQRTPGNTPTNIGVIKCYAGNDAEPNRVSLFIAGELRQIKSGPNGSGPGGVGRAVYIDDI